MTLTLRAMAVRFTALALNDRDASDSHILDPRQASHKNAALEVDFAQGTAQISA